MQASKKPSSRTSKGSSKRFGPELWISGINKTEYPFRRLKLRSSIVYATMSAVKTSLLTQFRMRLKIPKN